MRMLTDDEKSESVTEFVPIFTDSDRAGHTLRAAIPLDTDIGDFDDLLSRLDGISFL